jgi:DNA-binding transcriptional ArsR family regulator
MPTPKQARAAIDRVFHALGDPTRREMLEMLSERPVSISLLAEPLKISLAAVVQHIAVLEECALVRSEKNGRVRTCHLDPAGFSLAGDWLARRKSLWEKRLDRLGFLLDEEDGG